MPDGWVTVRELRDTYGLPRQTLCSRLQGVPSRLVRQGNTKRKLRLYDADEATREIEAVDMRRRGGFKAYSRSATGPICHRCGIVLAEAEAMWGRGDDRYCRVCQEELAAGHVTLYWDAIREAAR